MHSEGATASPLWKPILFGGLAGGLGWGIRGQYGHETGAMIAGLLICLTLALLLCPRAPAIPVLRAVAWGTVATGFGGSMTYGQTVGLTHDPELVGNWGALRWGLLGLSIKGGLWVGFAGLFLGMGLGGVRYRPREMLLAMLGALALCAVGIRLLNEPYDPANHLLPRIYFSDDWRWEPGAVLKPRREVWGGFLFALAGSVAYARWRRDPLAPRLAFWGILGGALGFPLGQSLQAFHAWNPGVFHSGNWPRIDPLINWWNFMETTFGAVMGTTLGAGLWVNRNRMRFAAPTQPPALSPTLEWSLLAVHVTLLTLGEFTDSKLAAAVYDFGLLLGLLPVVLITDGRWSALLVLLPITALPIAGKTLRNLAFENTVVSRPLAVLVLLILPLALTTWAAIRLQRRGEAVGATAETALRPALLFAAWLYFGLNFAFFRFPWPWGPWTARTPNALVFAACLLGLTWLALRRRSAETDPSAASNG